MTEFPGALLPAVALDGRIFWYALVRTPAEWRRLRPLLMAFAGPTVTSFDGQRIALRPEIPREAILMVAKPFGAVRLLPIQETVELAARSLARLITLIERKPPDLRLPPISTGAMLTHFEMCLATGDRGSAEGWLARLRNEWRLDELNL